MFDEIIKKLILNLALKPKTYLYPPKKEVQT